MYKLMAFTSGCRFQRRTSEPRQASELVKKKDDKVLLTKAFKYVAHMSSIFELEVVCFLKNLFLYFCILQGVLIKTDSLTFIVNISALDGS